MESAGEGAKSQECRVFAMRIVNVEYYMAQPLLDMDDCYSHFLGRSVMEVPVVRIYGSTISGQKTCLHLHKAFPYFYIPYDQDLPQSLDEALAYTRRLALALERAMKMASAIGAKRQHVHSCSLVRARKFYGYHPFEDTFIKITIYHPQEVNQMSTLLLSGGILDRRFQPYEAHISYLLQFKIDYNLAGMDHIQLANLRFRSPVPGNPMDRNHLWKQLMNIGDASNSEKCPEHSNKGFWVSSNIDSNLIWSEGSQERASSRCSTCELEVDATVEDILNKNSLDYTPLSQAEPGKMMVQSLVPMWEGHKQEDGLVTGLRKKPRKHFNAIHKELMDSICNKGPECSEETKSLDAENLLQSSQPANLHHSSDSSGNEDSSQEVNNVPEEFNQFLDQNIESVSELDHWKAADEEALELLKWMVSSQNNNAEDGLEEVSENSDDQGEIDLCRIFQGERVETALQKTISTYESLSQRECQEILDCCEENKEERANNRYRKQIPQYDGACDEEPSKTEDEENVNAKRRKWGTLPITIKESPMKSTQEGGTPRTPECSSGSPRHIRESRSSSVRDLMRVKRARRKLEAENDTDNLESSGKFNLKQYGALPLVNNQFQGLEGVKISDGICQAIEDPKDFKLENGEMRMVFHRRPPSKHEVLSTFKEHGLEPVKYSAASYGASEDVSDGIVVRGDPPAGTPTEFDNAGNILYLLAPARSPPSLSSVRKWIADNQWTSLRQSKQVDQSITPIARPASPKYDEMHALSIEHSPSVNEHKTPSSSQQSDNSSKRWSREFSQITGASLKQSTPASQTGFRDSSASSTGQQLTLMSIEVLAETRCNLRPDPQHDQISCIVIAIQEDNTLSESRECIVLLHDKSSQNQTRLKDGISGAEVIHFTDEVSLLHFFIRLVRVYDPDILLGWEVQRLSLGFLAERSATLGLGLLTRISRTPPKESLTSAFLNDDQNRVGIVPEVSKSIIEDEWGRTHGSGIYVGGRTVLNLWRIMRGEVKLGNYTLECVAEAVLKRKVPRISWRDLTGWFKCKLRFRAIDYFINRATLNLQIIDQLDLVNRTAELARVFGIDFYSVFSRGSQYRVESMMLRLAHSQNFLAISPSKEQVAGQPAMECLPLVMEPESKFYTSPVVVLDFQSLYPSMIIAYNLCFSTCLGKCTPLNPNVLGVTSLWLQPEVLRGLQDKITVSPNGVMFAPPEVAPGVLPRLLLEILSTRIMVKNEMKKLLPSQKVLHRILNARQFALKLIANVTYGYAAAGFSGRMPCAELADSIVQLGRHTLEQAIDTVNNNSSWDARVVYGDTDSMFVLLEGRTREEAFKIGQEIASVVTAANPEPVTLKMEKVYHPCVLLTKKRYVGYSYESPGQEVPTFDAKGIETVRRDSCGAVSKTMEKSLRLLFETCDLFKVKQYLQRQWQKIIGGRISIQDFIFSKEVRLGTYSTRASVLPPAAVVATKAMQSDPRAEPCYGERIQYVVVHGKPGSRLVDMVFDPYELIDETKGLRLHDTYYINKQIIPALQRVFWLLGVDLKTWLNEMPRIYQVPASKRPRQGYEASGGDENNEYSRRGRIDHYYASKHCVVCGKIIQGGRDVVCGECSSNHRLLHIVLGGRASRLEIEYQHIQAICMHCGGGNSGGGQIRCISLDCAIFFERIKLKRELENCLSLLHRLSI